MTDTDTTDTGDTPTAEELWAQMWPDLVNRSRAALGLPPVADPRAIPGTGLIPDVVDGQLIEAAWGNAVRNIGRGRFDTFAQLNTQWAAAPNGAHAVTLDTMKSYTRRGSVWSPDVDYQIAAAATFASGAATIPHNLGRVPTVVMAIPNGNIALMTATSGFTASTFGMWARTHDGVLFSGSAQIGYLAI